MAALADYEASLNEWGIPIDEATAINADPDNPTGTHRYLAESVIDWSALAVEQHLKSKGDKDEYRAARKISVQRVDKPKK